MTFDPNLSISVDDNITLRIPKLEDAEKLFALIDKNRTYLREFLGWLHKNTIEENTLDFIIQALDRMEQGELALFAICYQHNIVGLVGFQKMDVLNKRAQIGYWIDEQHQSKGIMKRSVQALIDYGIIGLHLHRIEILCAVQNLRSQGIPKKLGFKKEATLKDAIHHYGEYYDALLYALIASNDSIVLETERMILRKMTMNDVDKLQRSLADPETMKYYPSTRNVQETELWIQKQLKSYTTNGFGLWACHLKETGEFVGQCGLIRWDNIDGRQETEIGCLFVRQFWKRGLATEAAKGCLQYAQESLGYKRIIGLVRLENMPARRVAERIGMKPEKEMIIDNIPVLKDVKTIIYSIE